MRRFVLLAPILVASCAAAYRFDGPAAVGQDGRSFADAGGDPVFWQGDTQWELFTAYQEGEARAILDDRRAKGFNVVQVMLLGVKGVRRSNVHGDLPFVSDDPLTPNENYFKPIDAIVRLAQERQLTLAIGLFHKSPDWSKLITEARARSWAAWVGRRYASAPNIIWSMYPEAKDSYLPIVRELAAGVAEGDGGRHLITVHPDPAPASSSWIHQEPWLAFNTIQSFQSNFLNYRMVTADRARVPAKPTVNGEARYEAEGGTTPLMVRHGAWWSVLGGGFYTYGHGGNWQKPGEWRAWLDSPASRQMKVLGDFFRSLDWWNLVPDLSLISGPVAENVAARAANRDWALVYLPNGGAVAVASVPGRASWINPADGSSLPATAPFTAPKEWTDAVLFFDDRKN
jgi:hypothetical protein